jgi:hypothetical protein
LSDQEQDNESHSFHLEGGHAVFEKPKSQEEIARDRRESEQHKFAREQVKTNRKMTFFTGLLVLATGFGSGIGIWQATISQTAANAARDAADASKEAVFIAQRTLAETARSNNRQAQISQDQMATSRDQFRREHRPYLWQVSSAGSDKGNIQYRWGAKEGMPEMYVVVQVQNFGQSPAVITRFAGDLELGGTPDYLSRLSAHDWRNISSIMPPGRVDDFTVGSKETVPKGSSVVPVTSGSVGVLLRIQYTGTEGRPFESDMCMYAPEGMNRMASYCPADLHLTRLIDCQKEACEK